MRVVLDANIYVSALISSKGNPARIIRRWLDGEFDVLLSRPILEEIVRVTGYARIQRKYKQVRENRLEFVDLITEQSLWVQPAEDVSAIVADESDNRYLECTLAGGARYVVTGDQHLLEIADYQGVQIITPATFITLLMTGSA